MREYSFQCSSLVYNNQNKYISFSVFCNSGEYYSSHSNETAPTSPSVSGGQLSGVQDSTSNLTNGCDCNNINNLQEIAPTDAGAAKNTDPAGAAEGPADAASAAPSVSTDSSSSE